MNYDDGETIWLFEDGTPEWKKYAIVIGWGVVDGALAAAKVIIYALLGALVVVDCILGYQYITN